MNFPAFATRTVVAASSTPSAVALPPSLGDDFILYNPSAVLVRVVTGQSGVVASDDGFPVPAKCYFPLRRRHTDTHIIVKAASGVNVEIYPGTGQEHPFVHP